MGVIQHVFTRTLMGLCTGVYVHLVLHSWKLCVPGSTYVLVYEPVGGSHTLGLILKIRVAISLQCAT